MTTYKVYRCDCTWLSEFHGDIRKRALILLLQRHWPLLLSNSRKVFIYCGGLMSDSWAILILSNINASTPAFSLQSPCYFLNNLSRPNLYFHLSQQTHTVFIVGPFLKAHIFKISLKLAINKFHTVKGHEFHSLLLLMRACNCLITYSLGSIGLEKW